MDLLTTLFIAIIFGVFVLFFTQEKTSLARYGRGIERFRNVAELFGEKPVAELPNEVVETATQIFITESGDGRPIFRRRGTALVLRDELTNILPQRYSSEYRFVPALLTTAGVLGTFSGISVGLMDFNTAGASTAEITGAATSLLGGMKTAFWTSVVGMATSLIFMLLIYLSSTRADRQWRDAYDRLAQMAISPTVTELLSGLGGDEQAKLMKLQLQAAEQSRDFQNKLAGSLDNLNANLRGLSADRVGSIVGEAVRKSTREELAPAVRAIATQLEALKEIKADNGEALVRTIMTSIKDEVVAPMAQEMKQVAGNVIASTAAINSLTTSLTETSEKLSATTQVMTRFQEDTMGQLQSFARDMASILGEFQGSVRDTLQAVAAEIAVSLDVAKEGMESQRTAFQDAASRAATTFEDQNGQLIQIADKARTIMDGSAQAMAEGIALQSRAFEQTTARAAEVFEQQNGQLMRLAEEAGNVMNATAEQLQHAMEGQRRAFEDSAGRAAQAFAEQNGQLQQVGEQARELMADASRSLQEGLGDLDAKIKAMAAMTQEELEKFRKEYQSNLQEFFQQQANLLDDSLGRQRDGLAEVVDNFRGVFVDELQTRLEQYAKLSEGERVLRELNESILSTQAGVVTQLSEAARSMGSQVQRIEKAYLEGAGHFKQLGDDMPKAMKGWFEQARDTQHRYFQHFDQESAKVFGHLVDIAEILHSGGVARQSERELTEAEA